MATFTSNSSYSARSFSNNENITVDQGAKFTINQSTVDLRFVRCTTFGEVLVKNTSTTQPIIVALGSTGGQPQWRFEGAGITTIEGEFISLGIGNGVAGQSFSIPLAQGVNGIGTQSCPNLGGLFIESDNQLQNRTVVPDLALQVDTDDYNNAIDHDKGGNVFLQNTANNTITFKRAIPSGKNVYMCNIIFKTGDTFTGNTVGWDFATTGTANWNKCHWTGDFNVSPNQAKKITFKHIVLRSVTSLNIQNQVEAPELESVIISTTDNRYVLNASSSAQAGSYKNIWGDTANNGSENMLSINNTADPVLERIIITNYARTTAIDDSTGDAVVSCNSPNLQVRDLFCFVPLQPVYLQSGAVSAVINNVNFMFNCRTDESANLRISVIRANGSVDNAIITNITQINAGPVYSNYNAFRMGTGTSGNTISGVLLKSGTSGGNRMDVIVSDNGNENRYNDIVVEGEITNTAIQYQANSLGAKISNLYFVDRQNVITDGIVVGARSRIDQVYVNRSDVDSFGDRSVGSGVDSLSCIGMRNTANGGSVEKTDGFFQLRFSPTSLETQYFNPVISTGVIQFSNTNRLYIENIQDSVELESFTHNNVLAISSDAVVEGLNVDAFSITVKMRRPNGSYTPYVAMDQTAMQQAFASLESDFQNRVQFKFRILKLATDRGDYLSSIRFNITLTGDDFPFEIGGVQVTGRGLVPGSRVQLFNVSANTEVTNEVLTDVNFAIDYTEGEDYSQGDVVRLRATYQNGNTAYLPFEAFAVASRTGFSFLIDQKEATTYNAYNVDGTTITEFTLDLLGGKIEVDINDPDNTTNIQRIGAWYFGQLMTATGIESLFGAINWIAGNQISIDQDVVDLKIDNKKTDPLLLTGGRLYRLDESTVIASGSNSIQMDYTPVYVTNMPLVSEIEANTKLIPALL